VYLLPTFLFVDLFLDRTLQLTHIPALKHNNLLNSPKPNLGFVVEEDPHGASTILTTKNYIVPVVQLGVHFIALRPGAAWTGL
jgi:hypothetical protein